MNLLNVWGSLKQWIAGHKQQRAIAEFSCAHCERTDSCGKTPSDDCIEKLDQIERGDNWRDRPSANVGNRRQIP
jgi:hypothetical protein